LTQKDAHNTTFLGIIKSITPVFAS